MNNLHLQTLSVIHSPFSFFTTLIDEFKQKISKERYKLIKTNKDRYNNTSSYAPKFGQSQLNQRNKLQSARKIFTIQNDSFKERFNDAMSKQTFNELSDFIRPGVGYITATERFLFTENSFPTPAGMVCARTGDEIWHIEEIGKTRLMKANNYLQLGNVPAMPAFKEAFILIDPKRANDASVKTKGWLIYLSETKQLVV